MSPNPPWQNDHLAGAVLSAAVDTPRTRLSETRPSAEPAAYLLFLGDEVARFPLWRPFAGGRICCYVGSTVDAANRMCRHRSSLIGTDLSADDIWVALMPSSSHGWALYLESVLCSNLRPVWCEPRVRGWGSRTRGQQRQGGRNTAWDSLFPGRDWARLPTAVESASAALAVVDYLSFESHFAHRWPPLPARSDKANSGSQR